MRTAAIELRKRLATYYDAERHRTELRIGLVPGSYIPRFSPPSQMQALEAEAAPELAHFSFQIAPHPAETEHPAPPETHADPVPQPVARSKGRAVYAGLAAALVLAASVVGYTRLHARDAQTQFWKPVLDTPGAVLLAVGSVANGPPKPPGAGAEVGASILTTTRTASPTVPFADAVTLARVLGVLESHGKKVMIRAEGSSSFSDLREGPVVLIGAFNNEWSVRLTRQLRYSLALDDQQHLIYIRDAKHPDARNWNWATDKSTGPQGRRDGPPVQDYALISRIWNSETGHCVIVIGGLYTYGTQSAGEFLTDPQLMQAVAAAAPLADVHKNLQIVLGTTVTDDTPGPPRVLAVSTE